MLCPSRQRQCPAQFSWIDQRLVRDVQLHQSGLHFYSDGMGQNEALVAGQNEGATSNTENSRHSESIRWLMRAPLRARHRIRAVIAADRIVATASEAYRLIGRYI